jgi:hypothetical protein
LGYAFGLSGLLAAWTICEALKEFESSIGSKSNLTR